MKILVSSVTVSVSSRRQAGRPYENADNFASFALEKEDGSKFTPEEALRAKARMTLALKRLLLLDEMAQGLIDSDYYNSQRDAMEKRYGKILAKLEDSAEFLLRDPKVDDASNS